MELGSHIVTGIIMLLVGILLRELEARPRVVWWSPHIFLLDVPIGGGKPPYKILTHAITLQNLGRKAAENVEIVLNARPDSYGLQPSINYTELQNPLGQFVIKLAVLGAKEAVTIQILSHIQAPPLLSIRSETGVARQIPVMAARQFPQWVYRAMLALMLVGSGFLLYWIVEMVRFVSRNIDLF